MRACVFCVSVFLGRGVDIKMPTQVFHCLWKCTHTYSQTHTNDYDSKSNKLFCFVFGGRVGEGMGS